MGLPLACSEVSAGAATQVATLCVGAAVTAGAATHGTFIHILAAPKGLVKVEARWTDALEASQCVVAGGGATGRGAGALILICVQMERVELKAHLFPQSYKP